MIRGGTRFARVLGVAALAAALSTLPGTGASGLAATSGSKGARPALPAVQRVQFTGSVAHPTIVIIGRGFGTRPRPDPRTSPSGQQGCPTTPTSGAGHLFGTSLFVKDLNAQSGGFAGQQWDAGIFSAAGEGEFDCVGLIITSWSPHRITLRYGNLYNQQIPDNNYVLSNGDPVQVGVKGATFTSVVHGLRNPPGPPTTTTTGPSTTTTAPSSTTTTVVSSTTTSVPSSTTTAPPSTTTTLPPTTTTTRPSSTTSTAPSGLPTITSVTTSGSVASPTITVTGSGFGAQPPPNPTTSPSGQQGCPVTTDAGSGRLFGMDLSISDTDAQSGNQARWTAGQYDGRGTFDCLGLFITSWSSTTVTFRFGDLYNRDLENNFYVLTNGDPIVVRVKGAEFRTNVAGLA